MARMERTRRASNVPEITQGKPLESRRIEVGQLLRRAQILRAKGRRPKKRAPALLAPALVPIRSS